MFIRKRWEYGNSVSSDLRGNKHHARAFIYSPKILDYVNIKKSTKS